MEGLPFCCYQSLPHPNTHKRTNTHAYFHLKASCLLFHSSLYLPKEHPHFNINRMLHHSVAQTSPCCISPVALWKEGWHVEGLEQKKREKKNGNMMLWFSNVWTYLFWLGGKMRACAAQGEVTEKMWGFGVLFSPSDLIQRTNWDSLKHKTGRRSIVSSVCQSSRRDTGDLLTGWWANRSPIEVFPSTLCIRWESCQDLRESAS